MTKPECPEIKPKWGYEQKGKKQTQCKVCRLWRYPNEQAECSQFKPMRKPVSRK